MPARKRRKGGSEPGALEPSISHLVREIRARLGLSQERLASLLHVSFTTINRWENGKTTPEPRAWQAVEDLVRTLGPAHQDLAQRFLATKSVPVEPKAASRGPDGEDIELAHGDTLLRRFPLENGRAIHYQLPRDGIGLNEVARFALHLLTQASDFARHGADSGSAPSPKDVP